MQILGHGIDLADVNRMDQLLACFGGDAVERQFTDRERAEAPPGGARRATYFAGRFAAKEAVLKALGVGFARGVAFTDVEVIRSPGSAPQVMLRGQAAILANRRGVRGWMISISHSGAVAIASAIAIDMDCRASPAWSG